MNLKDRNESRLIKSSDDTLKSTLKSAVDLSTVKSADSVVKEKAVGRNLVRSKIAESPIRARAVSGKRYKTKELKTSELLKRQTTIRKRSVSKSLLAETAVYKAREVVSGGRPSEEDEENGTAAMKQGRRSAIRGVGAVYGAKKYRQKVEERTRKNLVRGDGDRTVKRAGENLVKQEGSSAERKYLKNAVRNEAIDIGRNVKSSGDNLGEDGIVEMKNAVYTAKDTVKVAKKVGKGAAQTAGAIRQNVNRTARLAEKASLALKNMFATAAKAIGNVTTAVTAATGAAPIILAASTMLIVVMFIVAIVPTWALKSEEQTLSKLYVYCTDLDARFSESVNKQLRKSGYDRTDFYINGMKSGVPSVWATETDLDTLLSYYDAMFEDYSFDETEDDEGESVEQNTDEVESQTEVEGDEDTGDPENSEQSEENEEDSEQESTIVNDYGKVKKYTKNLWKEILQLSVSTHTETEKRTGTNSEGESYTYTVTKTILDIYVEQKPLTQLIAENSATDESEDIFYENVFDTPFGYLNSSQKDVYEVLQEVGQYTALEEIANPFGSGDSTEESATWRTLRRYGYYIDVPGGNPAKQYHTGMHISATAGDAVYAGFSGTVRDAGNGTVTIKTNSRTMSYAHLSNISVAAGQQVTTGTKIGDVSGYTLNGTSCIYISYVKNGKAINPLFFLGGYGGNGYSGGIGNGDIVATALAEVGTLEVPVNSVKYNTWYYGSNVNGGAYPWCAVFVSWCAEQNGFIASGIVPRSAGCLAYVSFYQSRGQFHLRGSGYIPKPGDFILYGAGGGTHIGIVVSCDGSTVYTVEGNTSNSSGMNPNGGGVWTKSYSMSNSWIYGYASPSYPTSTAKTED